uniref:Uncharacterized protein n=1 Tax=Arundo donax TaxID=35708 RepID=A0A0A9B6V1_ARUDO
MVIPAYMCVLYVGKVFFKSLLLSICFYT